MKDEICSYLHFSNFSAVFHQLFSANLFNVLLTSCWLFAKTSCKTCFNIFINLFTTFFSIQDSYKKRVWSSPGWNHQGALSKLLQMMICPPLQCAALSWHHSHTFFFILIFIHACHTCSTRTSQHVRQPNVKVLVPTVWFRLWFKDRSICFTDRNYT